MPTHLEGRHPVLKPARAVSVPICRDGLILLRTGTDGVEITGIDSDRERPIGEQQKRRFDDGRKTDGTAAAADTAGTRHGTASFYLPERTRKERAQTTISKGDCYRPIGERAATLQPNPERHEEKKRKGVCRTFLLL